MSTKKVDPSPEEPEELTRFDKTKGIIKRNWKPFAIGAGTIIVIYIVTKRVDTRYLGGTVRTALLAKKIIIKDSVLFFGTYARQQGPPSWVIRCVETGRVFTSQADAARIMDLSPTTLSRHLNGLRDHVNGYHFIRVALATPQNG